MSKTLRANRLRSIPILFVLASLIILCACSEGDPSQAAAPTQASDRAVATGDATPLIKKVSAPAVHAEGEMAPRNPNERPLPAFEGTTIAGTKLAIRDLLGARIVLFFFNPEIDPASAIGEAVGTIFEEAGTHNFKVVGIGVGSNPSALSRFAKTHALQFPVIDDSSGSITKLLRIRAPNGIIGIDAEGYMSFGIGNFPDEGDVKDFVDAELRKNLRLPESQSDTNSKKGGLYAYPKAPELGVVAMSTG